MCASVRSARCGSSADVSRTTVATAVNRATIARASSARSSHSTSFDRSGSTEAPGLPSMRWSYVPAMMGLLSIDMDGERPPSYTMPSLSTLGVLLGLALGAPGTRLDLLPAVVALVGPVARIVHIARTRADHRAPRARSDHAHDFGVLLVGVSSGLPPHPVQSLHCPQCKPVEHALHAISYGCSRYGSRCPTADRDSRSTDIGPRSRSSLPPLICGRSRFGRLPLVCRDPRSPERDTA